MRVAPERPVGPVAIDQGPQQLRPSLAALRRAQRVTRSQKKLGMPEQFLAQGGVPKTKGSTVIPWLAAPATIRSKLAKL